MTYRWTILSGPGMGSTYSDSGALVSTAPPIPTMVNTKPLSVYKLPTPTTTTTPLSVYKPKITQPPVTWIPPPVYTDDGVPSQSGPPVGPVMPAPPVGAQPPTPPPIPPIPPPYDPGVVAPTPVTPTPGLPVNTDTGAAMPAAGTHATVLDTAAEAYAAYAAALAKPLPWKPILAVGGMAMAAGLGYLIVKSIRS